MKSTKLKKFWLNFIGVGALLFLIGSSNSASAATVQPMGAGEWDNIGTYTFSNVIRFQSGGGDLKVCVSSTTAKVPLLIKRSIFGGTGAVTAGGSPTNNCAIWRSIGGPGYVDLTWGSGSHPSSVKVTVFD